MKKIILSIGSNSRKAYVKPTMRTADILTPQLLDTSDTLDIFKDDNEWPDDPETGQPVEPW